MFSEVRICVLSAADMEPQEPGDEPDVKPQLPVLDMVRSIALLWLGTELP